MKNPIWSKTRLDVASTCDRKHYYQYYTNEEKLPSPWYFSYGRFFHSLAQRFFNEKGEPFRKSEEALANTAETEWKFIIRESKKKKDIDWLGINPYSLIPRIRKIASTLFNTYSKQTPSLATELRIDFALNSTLFTIRLDEVRENFTLRDHKTGYMEPMIRDYDLQPTLYILGYATALSRDREFAERNRVNPEEAKLWLEDVNTLAEKVKFEHHIISTGQILQTRRTQVHVEELLRTIQRRKESVESALKQGRIPEPNRGSHCGVCEFRNACERDSLNINESKPQLELLLHELPSQQLSKLKTEQLRIKFHRIKNSR